MNRNVFTGLCTVVLISVSLSLWFTKSPVFADGECTANISPTQFVNNNNTDVTFTVNNGSGDTWQWVRIVAPNSSIYTINAVSATDWNQDANDGATVVMKNGQLAPSSSAEFSTYITTGNSTDPTPDWIVEVSTDPDGASPIACSGSLSTQVVDRVDTSPHISGLTISDVLSSSVTVSWITDAAASSLIEYGRTNAYGSTKSSDVLVTSHSLSLTGLTANATYHLRITSVNDGGTGQTTDNTFNTAAEGASGQTITITTETVTTTTTIRTVTPTPTPTPLPDTTPPTIIVSTKLDKVFPVAPAIAGTVADNKIVSSSDYSLDGGVNWTPLPVKEAKSVAITFTPESLDDGNYMLRIRAKDGEGNIGYSKKIPFVVDRLPPLVGGNLLSLGPQPIVPTAQGVSLGIVGVQQKITFSAVGGPVSITIAANGKMFPAHKNPDNGLWSVFLLFDKPGIYPLQVRAVDGAKNTTERMLQILTIVPQGKLTAKNGMPLSHGKVLLYAEEPTTKQWSLWDGAAYGQHNPQPVQPDGSYAFFVPAGTYYLVAQADGMRLTTTEIKTFTVPTPVNGMIALSEHQALHLGSFSIPMLDLVGEQIAFVLPGIPQSTEKDSTAQIGKEAELFSLPQADGSRFELSSVRGTNALLSFVNTWSPLAGQQIALFNGLPEDLRKHIVIVVSQQSRSQVETFQKRGGYTLPFVVDTDSTLLQNYPITTVPTHYLLDRRGIVLQHITGVLTKEEISNYLVTGL